MHAVHPEATPQVAQLLGQVAQGSNPKENLFGVAEQSVHEPPDNPKPAAHAEHPVATPQVAQLIGQVAQGSNPKEN